MAHRLQGRYIMKMVIVLIIVALTGLGCAKPVKDDYVDPEALPYVISFSNLVQRPIWFSVTIVDKIDYPSAPGTQVTGLCKPNGTDREVLLLKSWWRVAPAPERNHLVWHELVHCMLGYMKHDDRLDPYGQPISIMYSSTPPPGTFSAKKQQFEQEILDIRDGIKAYVH